MAKAPLAKDSVNFSFKPETSVLGIDLGTTNIVVSLHKAGDTRSNIIVFKNGKRIMPSYAQFDETGKCVSVGEPAQRQIRITPGFVLYGLCFFLHGFIYEKIIFRCKKNDWSTVFG